MTPITLYGDHGCPFAHRVLAMLTHLDVEHTVHQSPIGEKPPGLSRHSKSERIPLLVHGDLVLTESSVMLDYLAERFDFGDGYPDGVVDRARHRHAISLVDQFLTPRISAPLEPGKETIRFDEVLDVFARAFAIRDGVTLFALHVAPIWLQLNWARPDSAAVAAVTERRELRRQLDETLQLPCIHETTPDRDRVRAEVERARDAGLVDDDPFRAVGGA